MKEIKYTKSDLLAYEIKQIQNSEYDKIKNEYAILQKKFNDIVRENSKFKNEKENINHEINKLNIQYNKMQVDNAVLNKKNKEMKDTITKLHKDMPDCTEYNEKTGLEHYVELQEDDKKKDKNPIQNLLKILALEDGIKVYRLRV